MFGDNMPERKGHMMENNKIFKYNRYLSPLDVWAISFGCTIGWGAFIMPGSTFLPAAGPLGTLIGIAVSAAVMLIIGANVAFLMRRNPGTGGIYSYTKEALGRKNAFVCAWFLTLSYLAVLLVNAISLFTVIRTVFGGVLQTSFRSYTIAGNVISLGEVGASMIALACVGLLFINAKPLLQHLQTILALLLLAGVLVVAVFCVPHLGSFSGFIAEGGSFGIQGNSQFHAVLSIVMLTPLIFFGFESASLETVHFKFKVKRSRWIIVLSLLLSGLVYMALTLISVSTTPDGYASWQAYIADLGQLSGLPSIPTFFAAKTIMGDTGLYVIAFAALAAILTGMIAAYRATTRMLATMGENEILSGDFQKTNHSIMIIMVIAILISILGKDLIDCFLDLAALGAVVVFFYTSVSAWRLARKSSSRLAAVSGALGTIASVIFAAVTVSSKLTAVEIKSNKVLLMLALWCLIGFVFYLVTVVRRRAARPVEAES